MLEGEDAAKVCGVFFFFFPNLTTLMGVDQRMDGRDGKDSEAPEWDRLPGVSEHARLVGLTL